jgi:hypothetical protein
VPLGQHHDLSCRFVLLHAAMRLNDFVEVELFLTCTRSVPAAGTLGSRLIAFLLDGTIPSSLWL